MIEIFLGIFFICVVLILYLLFEQIYQENKNKVFEIAQRVKAHPEVIRWIVFACDCIIGAMQSVFGVVFLAVGIFLAHNVFQIPIRLGDTDIAMSDLSLLAFIFIYAMIVTIIFFILKNKVKRS